MSLDKRADIVNKCIDDKMKGAKSIIVPAYSAPTLPTHKLKKSQNIKIRNHSLDCFKPVCDRL